MTVPNPPRFSGETLAFLRKATRQKNPEWLDRHHETFLEQVRNPLTHLATELAKRLRAEAPGYHFPRRGLGRLRRSAPRALEYGSLYRAHVSFTATRPAKSRFDHNPSIFFMIDSEDDEGDEVLLAGGLYMPSSRQLKSIRTRISENAAPFEDLFRSKLFHASFPDGFSTERSATRPPRGFDKEHPRIPWLKLQGYFVWRSYKPREYTSAKFPEQVARDARQILRLNDLLENAIEGRWPEKAPKKFRKASSPSEDSMLDRAGEKVVLHTPDF